MKNTFTNKINDYPVPKDLHKPLSVKNYDGTIDSDDHIETVDTLLSLWSARDMVKCKNVSSNIVRRGHNMVENLNPPP